MYLGNGNLYKVTRVVKTAHVCSGNRKKINVSERRVNVAGAVGRDEA